MLALVFYRKSILDLCDCNESVKIVGFFFLKPRISCVGYHVGSSTFKIPTLIKCITNSMSLTFLFYTF